MLPPGTCLCCPCLGCIRLLAGYAMLQVLCSKEPTSRQCGSGACFNTQAVCTFDSVSLDPL